MLGRKRVRRRARDRHIPRLPPVRREPRGVIGLTADALVAINRALWPIAVPDPQASGTYQLTDVPPNRARHSIRSQRSSQGPLKMTHPVLVSPALTV